MSPGPSRQASTSSASPGRGRGRLQGGQELRHQDLHRLRQRHELAGAGGSLRRRRGHGRPDSGRIPDRSPEPRLEGGGPGPHGGELRPDGRDRGRGGE